MYSVQLCLRMNNEVIIIAIHHTAVISDCKKLKRDLNVQKSVGREGIDPSTYCGLVTNGL